MTKFCKFGYHFGDHLQKFGTFLCQFLEHWVFFCCNFFGKNKMWTLINSGFTRLVAGGGLEPPTFGLWAQRAANCSTPRRNIVIFTTQLYYTTKKNMSIAWHIFLNFFVFFCNFFDLFKNVKCFAFFYHAKLISCLFF